MWTETRYPEAMENLSEKARQQAIKYVNEYMRDGKTQGRAISLAIERARNGDNHDDKMPGPAVVVYHKGTRWCVKSADEPDREMTFLSRPDALRRANDLASRRSSVVYELGRNNELSDSWENFDKDFENEKAIHVMPYRGDWAVNDLSTDIHFETYRTKKTALKYGKMRAQERRALLVVHYTSGEVAKRQNYL